MYDLHTLHSPFWFSPSNIWHWIRDWRPQNPLNTMYWTNKLKILKKSEIYVLCTRHFRSAIFNLVNLSSNRKTLLYNILSNNFKKLCQLGGWPLSQHWLVVTSEWEATFSETTLVYVLQYVTFVLTPRNQKEFRAVFTGTGFLQFAV